MARKTDYQFTAVPTQLFLCLDNNCRSTLFSLIQLSSFYENKNENAFDGWFFRTNALLEEETNLSKNVLNGALDALYQAGIIDVIPQDKGRGKAQGARKYKVNFDTFTKYQSIPFEECSCSHPDFGIVTSDYKKGAPKFQHRPQLEEQLKHGKSDNNIDNTDNTEILDIIDIENINNIDNNLINNNLVISSHSEEEIKPQVEIDKYREEPNPSYNQGDVDMDSLSFSSRNLDTPIQVPEEPDTIKPSPSISSEFIESQIPFVYSKVRREGETGEPDNYTEAANDILDEWGKEVSGWISCIKSKSMFSGSAMTRLVEAINGREYGSQAECEKTALDLMDYAAKSDARYANELRSMLYN